MQDRSCEGAARRAGAPGDEASVRIPQLLEEFGKLAISAHRTLGAQFIRTVVPKLEDKFGRFLLRPPPILRAPAIFRLVNQVREVIRNPATERVDSIVTFQLLDDLPSKCQYAPTTPRQRHLA